MCELSNRVQRLARLKAESELFALVKETGFKSSQIEKLSDEFATRKPEEGEIYYYYSGPLDEKTRPFCKLMLRIDKVFSEDQINYMSKRLGYSVLEYKGSYNCRHKWVRFHGKFISTPEPTVNQIRKLIDSGIKA